MIGMHVNLFKMGVARLENLHVSKADWPVTKPCYPEVSES